MDLIESYKVFKRTGDPDTYVAKTYYETRENIEITADSPEGLARRLVAETKEDRIKVTHSGIERSDKGLDVVELVKFSDEMRRLNGPSIIHKL